ncbi:RDD family protein [Candidatus Bathyarchaeota archaeon]|nr:RDD family protein [Candidatus Bathyarchaeota archaeon]
MPYCKNCGSEVPAESLYCSKCGKPLEAAAGFKLAHWGERFVAWLIDIIILGAIMLSLRFFASVAWPGYAFVPSFPVSIPFFDFGLSNIVYFLYWTFMEGSYGRSIGKMIMRIKVVRVRGEPMDLAHAALESLGKAFVLPLDCILGWILHAPRRQRIFNYVSETVVAKA